MTTDKYYTPAQLAELIGLQPQDITKMYIEKRFPNAIMEKGKPLQIPESDASFLLSRAVKKVNPVPIATPVVQKPVDKPLPPSEWVESLATYAGDDLLSEKVSLPEDVEPPETIDPPISQSEIERMYLDAQKVIDAADAYAKETRGKAESYRAEFINKINSESDRLIDERNFKLKSLDAEMSRNIALNNEKLQLLLDGIADKTAELDRLNLKLQDAQKAFIKLYNAALENKSYAYQMAVSDRWGKFAAAIQKIFRKS